MWRCISLLPRRSSLSAIHLLISRWHRTLLRGGDAAGRRARGARGRPLFVEELETREVLSTLTLSPGTLPAGIVNLPYSQSAATNGMQAPSYASQVVNYVPGTLSDPSYNDPSAALGGLNPVAASFGGTNYYLTPFDPAFGPSNLVEIGAGGSLTLKLAQPASTNGYTIGVHTGIGLLDADWPNGVNTSPASYFNSWVRQADVLVSADGVNWGDLGTVTFDNPSNYSAGSATDPEGQSPGVGTPAMPGKPFLGSLSSFNGQDWQGTLATLNGSEGGTWLNLSGVKDANGNPLSAVNYIQFVVPSNPPTDPGTGNPAIMMVDAVVGTNTAPTITAGGATGAVTLTVSHVKNPIPGLTLLGDGTGSLTISGTPTASGTETFTATATDALGATVRHVYQVRVNPAIVLHPTTLTATFGNTFTSQLSATGGSGKGYTFASPDLPSWLTLSTTGLLTGSPSSTTPVTFTVTATDSNGATGARTYAMAIDPAVVVSPDAMPVVTVGNAFSTQLTATGGNGTGFVFSATGLPAWLHLTGTGLLSGSPSAAAVGTSPTITVTATDRVGGTGTAIYALTVDPRLVLTPARLSPATVGNLFSVSLAPSGGSGLGYTLTPRGLPSWLTLSGDTLSGTPTTASSVMFGIKITDSVGATARHTYTLRVNPAIVVHPATLTATVGDPFSAHLSATGGSGQGYTFSMPPLAGLTLTAGGHLTGSLNSSITFTVTATDSNGAIGQRTYTVTVDPAVSLNPTQLKVATVGQKFSTQVSASGGNGMGYVFSAAGLPSWLKITPAGRISGTPPASAGTSVSFTVKATDSRGGYGTVPYTLTIDPALAIAPRTLPAASAGVPYSEQFIPTGGSGTGYEFSAIGLPAWLQLSNDGLLTGTPPATSGGRSVHFTVVLNDSNGARVSRAYRLTERAG
jgi:hypothetical protein